jgi:hypothetical protein
VTRGWRVGLPSHLNWLGGSSVLEHYHFVAGRPIDEEARRSGPLADYLQALGSRRWTRCVRQSSREFFAAATKPTHRENARSVGP